MSRLALRQIGVYPKPVAGKQVRDFTDGKAFAAALYAHVDLRTRQVERRIIGDGEWEQKEAGQEGK